jgi:hypothetical protein
MSSRHRLTCIASRLAAEETGAVLSMEMILTATILVLGSIVGLSAFRDAVVQEMGDIGAGLASLDHSYRYNSIEQSEVIENVFLESQILGSSYSDNLNFCEPAVRDPSGAAPMCIEITTDAIVDENDPLP